MKIFFAAVITAFAFAIGLAQNEQQPIVEKQISYQNWKYKPVQGGDEIDLRKFAKDKKLVIVVYYAPWCPNWKHDMLFLPGLYDKYKSAGLEIIGVGEYDSVASMKTNQQTLKVPFPLVYESESRDDRQKTHHYEYRTATGDTRKWGSPWYIFIEPRSMEKQGDTLVKKTHVINGEMIQADGETFIREKLGLPPEDVKARTAKTDAVEVCDPKENKSAELKKP